MFADERYGKVFEWVCCMCRVVDLEFVTEKRFLVPGVAGHGSRANGRGTTGTGSAPA